MVDSEFVAVGAETQARLTDLGVIGGCVDPVLARGGPRAELYLVVDDVAAHHRRALAVGGKELDPPRARDWGDLAGYVLDPDGHVIAFAAPLDRG